MAETEKISIEASELKELLATNRALMEKIEASEQEYKPTLLRKEISERLVRITFVGGKPVIGFANRGTDTKVQYTYERPDPENTKESILYVDVLLQGEEKPLPIRYKELMNEAEHVECKILRTEEKPWEVVQGTTEAMELPEGDKYRMESKGYSVAVGATGVKRTYTVQLPDGSELNIADDYVNIA